MRYLGHVACTEREERNTVIWWGNLKDVGIYGRIILN
jgi:hypothetical protein